MVQGDCRAGGLPICPTTVRRVINQTIRGVVVVTRSRSSVVVAGADAVDVVGQRPAAATAAAAEAPEEAHGRHYRADRWATT
jgi:ribosomal protein L6P/L9E